MYFKLDLHLSNNASERQHMKLNFEWVVILSVNCNFKVIFLGQNYLFKTVIYLKLSLFHRHFNGNNAHLKGMVEGVMTNFQCLVIVD